MGVFLSAKQSFLSIEELREVVQNFEMCYFNLKSRNIESLMLNFVCCILLSNLFGDIRQRRTKTWHHSSCLPESLKLTSTKDGLQR